MRQLLQLRRQPPRQIGLQRFRSRRLSGARARLGFFVNRSHRMGRFSCYFFAERRVLLFPLLESHPPFRIHRLHRRFLRCRIDLLSCLRQ